MTSIRTYLEQMRRDPFSRTRALEQELETVREAHERVSADLDELSASIFATPNPAPPPPRLNGLDRTSSNFPRSSNIK